MSSQNSWTRTKNLIDPDRRSTRKAVKYIKQASHRADRRTFHVTLAKIKDLDLVDEVLEKHEPKPLKGSWELR